MAKTGANRYRGIFTSFLMVTFFASQIFSCCLVNQKLGHFLESAFAAKALSPTASHSCCHRSIPVTGDENPNRDAAQHQGCCIQDANQKLPQMPSEHMPVPVMPELIIGILTASVLDLPALPARIDLRSSSSPPVYLTQLRLLI